MANEILISSSVRDTIKQSAELAKELNTGLEISRIPLYKIRQLTVSDTIKILKDELSNFDNSVTLHAMFSDVNVAGQDCLLREISQLRCYQSFEIGKAINAKTILFHSGYKGTRHEGSIKNFKSNFIGFWKEFIKDFERAGITAVIENVFEPTPEFIAEIEENIASDNLKLAIDTGHVNLYAPNTKLEDWINLYGNRLKHMHIHNNYQKNDDHNSLQNGTINFENILNYIKQKEITASIVFEMFNEDDIRKSLDLYKRIMN